MTNELDMLDVTVSSWMLSIGTRLGERDDAGRLPMNRALRTQSLDALLVASSDYDVIFVESIAHSYSCIKRVVPDLVIISSEVDDVAACQLLCMLRVDRRSMGIPVRICPTFGEQDDLDDAFAALDQDTSTQSLV